MKHWSLKVGVVWSVGVASALGIDLRYAPTPAQREELLSRGWEAAREILEDELLREYRPGMAGRPGSTGTSGYRQWLLLWKWCELLSRREDAGAQALVARHLFEKPGDEKPTFFPIAELPPAEFESAREEVVAAVWKNSRTQLLSNLLPAWLPEPRDIPLSEIVDPVQTLEWVQDPVFSEALFGLLAPEDYAPGVLANLQAMARAAPQKFREYANLALAIAVVYDVKFPEAWPHHQVAREAVPLALEPPEKQFSSWMAANESRQLLTDLRKLRPGHLKFVVDAPLAASEFDWARKETRFSRADLARAFSAVPYRMERVKSGEFDWPGADYTLSAIFRTGGICVDQAYFAMVVGKARGVPTLFFTGQGADGGHAWFGFLKTGDRWEMDAGRYENQNYAVGEALDPQTWLPISDHELRMLAEGYRDRPEYAAARNDLLLAGRLEARGAMDRAAKAYESATAVSPQSPEAWEARGAFLERSGAPAALRKAFHEAALRQFEGRRDLRVRHQLALADLAREAGDAATADSLEKKIVSENRMRRADLSVGAAARRLSDLLEKKEHEKAFQEYRSMLRSLRRTGGGAFFYEVVDPFVRALLASGDSARAREACELARRTLNPSAESILARELDDLARELESGKPGS